MTVVWPMSSNQRLTASNMRAVNSLSALSVTVPDWPAADGRGATRAVAPALVDGAGLRNLELDQSERSREVLGVSRFIPE